MAKGRVNPYPEVASFRPHQDLTGDLAAIITWCDENGSSLQAVLNSYLPAIAASLTRFTFEAFNPETGKKERYIKSDFGDIFLRPNHYTQRQPREK